MHKLIRLDYIIFHGEMYARELECSCAYVGRAAPIRDMIELISAINHPERYTCFDELHQALADNAPDDIQRWVYVNKL